MSHEHSNDGIELECPLCGAEVGYDDVESGEGDATAQCPECGGESPVEDWFE